MELGLENQRNISLYPNVNYVSEGTIINGDIYSEKDLMINGTINGTIKCTKKMTIAHQGRVLGNISGLDIVVYGSLDGNIDCDRLLILNSQSQVHGNISSVLIEIHAGAKIESEVYVQKVGSFESLSNISQL